MFTILPRPINGPHPNTDSDDFVINKFERVRQIFQSRTDIFREQLLQKDNSKILLDAFPRGKRRYRYHSVISVSIDDITSSGQNFRFLKKMKQKSDFNSEFLLADCIEVYESLQEGLHRDIVYNLIGLVIQLKDTDVARLRELECEKIFRKIQALLKDLNCPRRERTASIDYQYKEEYLAERKDKTITTHSKTQFLLARFEFIIATLGHFIHYHTIANTPQKKAYSRAFTSRGSVFNSIFTSMETKTKKDICEVPKKNSIRSDLRSVSRKESLDGFSLVERIQSKANDVDESLKESKFQQVKSYFKWKLEKWKDQDLEEIVLVCRICSKSMSAKIMKKHSPHCKQVAEEEKALKEIGKRMANIIHNATKERHNVNVELIIEKKQLVSLREQNNGFRELEEMGWNKSPEASPMLIKNAHSTFTYEINNITTESKPKDKIQIVREELKTLDAFCSPDKQNNALEVPRLNFTPAPMISFQNNCEEPLSSPESMPECHLDFIKPRLSRQSSKDSLRSSTQTSHRSKSQSRADEAGDEEDVPLQNFKNSPKESSPRFMPKLNIITKTSIFAKEKEMQTFSASAANVVSPTIYEPSSAGFFEEESNRMLRRSQTPVIRLGMDSPTYPLGRKSNGRRAETRIDSKRKGSEDNQTLNTLREKLGRIKFLQTLIKGYDVLINYANIIDNFNEFSSEARIVYDEGKTEAGYFTGKVIGNRKFEEYTQEYLGILTEKLEILKSIDMSKKELRMLELAPETSESNMDSRTVTHDAASSIDSFEIISNSDLSPGYPRKKSPSFTLKKAYTPEADKRKFTMSPEGSPMIKRTRKLRSKSVEKPATNLRYELFEKNIQKVIKKIKQGKIQSSSSISKFPRSQFYRNSTATATLVFEEDQQEELYGEKSPTEIKGRARTTSIIASIQEKAGTKSNLTSESSDSSDDSEVSECESQDNVFDAEQMEKSFFSDDESNLKKCAKMQEDGFSSIIGIIDFDFIKLISKGAYGRVWLVQRKITGDYYAMKIINFADRKNMNQIDSLKKEKKVFEVLKGDFVVKATFTFVHNNYLCIVMELMIGGDFNNILESFGALEEDVAKFYIAEIVLALSNLHQLGIVHRDLKPDNILLNKNGHIKLTDFGLSEVGIQKQKRANKLGRRTSIINSLIPTAATNTERRMTFPKASTPTSLLPKRPDTVILHDEFSTIPEVDEEAPETAASIKGNRIIGTPDYMAPEVINGTCYDDSCIDWWSVGVILFEFIVGIPPFNDTNMDVVFENILKRKIPWDDLTIGYGEGCVTPEAKDLIDRLLEPDRTKRIGARGVEEIQKHPFFKEINWDDLLKGKAPIIPETENEIDVRNFRKETKKFTESELENPFHDKSPQHNMLVSINKETFEFARLDILHEENQKVVEEATNTISQEELEKMRKDRLKNRKWSVFD